MGRQGHVDFPSLRLNMSVVVTTVPAFNSGSLQFHSTPPTMDSNTPSYSRPERCPLTNKPGVKSGIEDNRALAQTKTWISNSGDLQPVGRTDVQDNSSLQPPPSPPLSVYGINQIPLQNRLLSILRKIPGHDEKKGFFPENELTALMSEEYVRQELELCFEDWASHKIEDLAKAICTRTPSPRGSRAGFKRIFAILVLCEKPHDIVRFLEENVSDADLPLHKSASPEELPNFFKLVRKGQSNALKSFRKWSYTAIWRFEEWQWTTIAPFFKLGSRKDVKHLQLQDQAALPFTQDSRFVLDKPAYEKLEFEGGYSNVFKIDIHPDHHNLCEPNVGCRIEEQYPGR